MYPIRLVVQQQIAGTHTYKVIYPTRNNFGAVNIFDRETMWAPITANELQAAKDRETQAKNEEAARKIKEQEAKDKQKANQPEQESEEQRAAREAFAKEEKLAEKAIPIVETDILIPNPESVYDVDAVTGADPSQSQAIDKRLSDEAARIKQEAMMATSTDPYVLARLGKVNLDEPPSSLSTEAVLKQNNIRLKSQGVDVSKLTSETVEAAKVAGGIYIKYGKIPIITSAYDSFEKHKKDSKHLTGDAVDFRTKHLNLSQSQKIALADEIRDKLNKTSNSYTVLYEDPGGDEEHFHIQYNDAQIQKAILE